VRLRQFSGPPSPVTVSRQSSVRRICREAVNGKGVEQAETRTYRAPTMAGA
jgi:hypothetical protein